MGERVGQIAKVPEVKKSSLSSRVRKTERLQSMDTPVDRILFLQRTAGNQAVSRLMKSGALQAKLRIGQPGDVYEQEADRVADAVMRMPEPGVQRQVDEEEEEEMLQTKPLVDQITPLVQRQVEDEEEEEMLQAKGREDSTSGVTNDLESEINAIHGGGRPLAESERAYFEPRFGHDFSQVRMHTDTQAAESARAVNARAYTIENNIVFGEGQYNHQTNSGKRLLAHELTHVVQQSGGRVGTHVIQRDLQGDIGALLGMRREDVPPPTTQENREATIRRLLTMEIPPQGAPERTGVVMERRRVLWEVLRTIDDPSEAESLHSRLQTRSREDLLSEPFHRNLATAVRENVLRLLRGIYRPGQLAVEAAESFPGGATVPPGAQGIGFGSFRSSLRLNQQYWIVKYTFRLRRGQQRTFPWETRGQTEIVFSTDSRARRVPEELDQSGPQGVEQFVVAQHANRVMRDNRQVQWDTRYLGPVVEIIIGNLGPEAAITDLWDTPASRPYYAFECWIAAILAELRGTYLFYSEEAREAEFDREYQEFCIIRYAGGAMDTNLAPPIGRPAGGPGSGHGLRILHTGSDISQLPEDQRPPLAQEARYQRVLHPGDWVILHNRFLGDVYESENAIYLGTNRFFGHPLGIFTIEEYAQYLYDPWNAQGRRHDWPENQDDIPDGWYSVLTQCSQARRQDSRPAVPITFPMRRPWQEVSRQVIRFVGQNTEVVPRARARADVRPEMAMR